MTSISWYSLKRQVSHLSEEIIPKRVKDQQVARKTCHSIINQQFGAYATLVSVYLFITLLNGVAFGSRTFLLLLKNSSRFIRVGSGSFLCDVVLHILSFSVNTNRNQCCHTLPSKMGVLSCEPLTNRWIQLSSLHVYVFSTKLKPRELGFDIVEVEENVSHVIFIFITWEQTDQAVVAMILQDIFEAFSL